MPDKILTIAGSDSLSGGGIQADLATFSEYGYFGLAVTTAIVTVTTKDFQVFPIAPHIIAASQKLSAFPGRGQLPVALFS